VGSLLEARAVTEVETVRPVYGPTQAWVGLTRRVPLPERSSRFREECFSGLDSLVSGIGDLGRSKFDQLRRRDLGVREPTS